jgi:hypothetical protein
VIPFLTSFGFWPVQLSLDCCDFSAFVLHIQKEAADSLVRTIPSESFRETKFSYKMRLNCDFIS